MNENVDIEEAPHYFKWPFMQVHFQGTRAPRTLKEWATCFYNFDLFLGKVPVGKILFVLQGATICLILKYFR